MVDRVVRLTEVHNVEQTTRGQHVVLKVTGKSAGKMVRAELSLDAWDTTYLVNAMRAGVDTQLKEWQRAKDELK